VDPEPDDPDPLAAWAELVEPLDFDTAEPDAPALRAFEEALPLVFVELASKRDSAERLPAMRRSDAVRRAVAPRIAAAGAADARGSDCGLGPLEPPDQSTAMSAITIAPMRSVAISTRQSRSGAGRV
jgi:hypothetical protein